jgi:hypothetical protein
VGDGVPSRGFEHTTLDVQIDALDDQIPMWPDEPHDALQAFRSLPIVHRPQEVVGHDHVVLSKRGKHFGFAYVADAPGACGTNAFPDYPLSVYVSKEARALLLGDSGYFRGQVGTQAFRAMRIACLARHGHGPRRDVHAHAMNLSAGQARLQKPDGRVELSTCAAADRGDRQRRGRFVVHKRTYDLQLRKVSKETGDVSLLAMLIPDVVPMHETSERARRPHVHEARRKPVPDRACNTRDAR